MALSVILGLMLGGGVAALLEFRDRFFHTGNDVRDNLRMRFLGYLPFIGERGVEAAKPGNSAATPVVKMQPLTPTGRSRSRRCCVLPSIARVRALPKRFAM